jgi:transcriptional regulator with XRE-family HTH domain
MGKKKDTGFAARLRALREAANLTQAQLAERAGLHLHGITKLEQGDREPAWATVLALADALGVDCRAFVDSHGSPPGGASETGPAPQASGGGGTDPKPGQPTKYRQRPRKEK